MTEYLEREDKYDVAEDFVLPDLVTAVDGARRKHVEVRLENTYFDTADGSLLARGLLLRRRIGGSDEGWQLKVPEGDGRVELQEPLGDRVQIPQRLLDVLEGIRLGKPLDVVAHMVTRRSIDRIVDADGEALVDVADDRVEAEDLRADSAPMQWREVEVEVVAAPPSVLRAARKQMLAAGASTAAASSKLARVLGAPSRPTIEGTRATSAVAAYVTEQIDEILRGDVGLRRGVDPIHATRVAIRRLRSTLRVFGDFITAAPEIDEELKWFAGTLGEVRDRQVQRAYFAETLATLPPEHLLGPVAADIEQTLLGDELRARTEVAEVMAGERYHALLALLTEWAAQPPVVADADDDRLRHAIVAAEHKADKRLKQGIRSSEDEPLHRARKAAKRARYAAELGRPVLGKRKSKRQVKHYKKIQTELGDHQDAAVAAETLWRLGARTGTEGSANGFTYGLLFAREQARAEAAVAAVRKR